MEVLIKATSKLDQPRKVENTRIPTDNDENNIPSNDSYLAYNFLTRNVSKARRIIDNYSINQKLDNGSYLEYKHDIFISCPITYIKSEEQFNALRESVGNIIQVLIKEYGFKQENIYCEMVKYMHFDEIRRDDRHLYFQTRQYLRASHFISLIPENMGNHASSIYMEIYFRILKKLPALVFLEKRLILPSLLHGVVEGIDRPVNITFKDLEMRHVASYLKDAKDYLLQYLV